MIIALMLINVLHRTTPLVYVFIFSSRLPSSFWQRVFRLAAPLQFLLLLLCLTSAFVGPNCCDHYSNYASIFSPQLHYIDGPPPI